MPEASWAIYYNQIDLFGAKENLYGRFLTRSNTKVIVGQFFEYLTNKLFKNSCRVNSTEDVHPDVVIWNDRKKKMDHDILIEVKASKKGYLFDYKQIQKYDELKTNDFPYTKPDIYFALYSYECPQLLSLTGSVFNLLKELGNSITGCTIVPFDVIKEIIKWMPQYDYKKWAGDNRQFYYRLSSRYYNMLRICTCDSVIDTLSIMSGNSYNVTEHFKINRYKINNINLEFSRVRPFPLIVVSNNSMAKFIDRGEK
jgi:hypothetical protein